VASGVVGVFLYVRTPRLESPVAAKARSIATASVLVPEILGKLPVVGWLEITVYKERTAYVDADADCFVAFHTDW
jgi:hypothetical protein